MCIAQFIDGTKSEITGMLPVESDPKRRRIAAPKISKLLKRPAAKKRATAATEDGEQEKEATAAKEAGATENGEQGSLVMAADLKFWGT